MKKNIIKIKVQKLSANKVSDFFWEHDNDYFEKLSDRIDIDEYSQKIYENAIHFVVYMDDILIGFSPCYFNNLEEKNAYISSLTIRDGYRRSKLGSRLLEEIKRYANDKGFTHLVVSVHCDNDGSINFYKKNNFTISHKSSETNTCSLECVTQVKQKQVQAI